MYSKTCVKSHSKIDKTKILMTNGSLMKLNVILLTCIKQSLALNTIFWSFRGLPFYTGFTVYQVSTQSEGQLSYKSAVLAIDKPYVWVMTVLNVFSIPVM